MRSIDAIERKEKGVKARKNGFIPGVIYGKELNETVSIKFRKNELLKILKEEGDKTKLSINFDGKDNFAIIKNIDRNPLNGEDIYNIDIQLVEKDEEIRQYVPLIFEGKGLLESKGLSIQTICSEVELSGKAAIIPKSITVSVGKKENGDTLTVKEIELDEGLKIIEDDDTTIAAVSYPRA